MILIADGGSTKADWVALDLNGVELYRTRTHGINPAILDEKLIEERIVNNFQLMQSKNEVTQIYFYGAGCGTDQAKNFLKNIFKGLFPKAEVFVHEDMLAAVFAASGGKESIVCILGTGSNSCYYDGNKMHQNVVSLGYIIMDEASANYFGKLLIRDYYYKRMPENIYNDFGAKFDLNPDVIKRNIYKEEAPNTYLGEFSKIMFDFKDSPYILRLLDYGFREFFELRVLPYSKAKEVPVYFVGSIAYYFQHILEHVAKELGIQFGGTVQRPIDDLIKYHQKKIKI
jgi:N-acetylglucosamine kinase-like BadF-type ATPase